MGKVLVLYYSDSGHAKYLADEIALGVHKVSDVEAVVRTLPGSFGDAPHAEISDLAECQGLVFGSPTHFGHMASPMQYYFEQAVDLWLQGSLIDKPFGVFTSSASIHGGQESTLLSMALPCLHMGMLYVGVPYSVSALSETKRGGSPYGASQWSEGETELYPSRCESEVARALGERVARISCKMLA